MPESAAPAPSPAPGSIVVVGAGPALGRAVARRYAADGYELVLVARRPEPLEEAAAELRRDGAVVHAVPGDVSEPAGMAGLAERIRERIGNPTTLYYGPSVGGFSTATDLTPDQIESHLPVALSSLVGLVREFLPPMIERREGAILVAGGMSAVHGMRNFSGPGPALAAQRNYLQSLTAEVAEHGVFVGRLYIGTAIIGSAWHKRMLAQAGDGSPAGSPAGPAPVDPETLADLLREMHRAGKPAETLYPEEFRAR